MSLFEETPEGLRDQIWNNINGVNPDDWYAHSVGNPYGIVLVAAPAYGAATVEVNLANHPFFASGGDSLSICSDVSGCSKDLNTTKRIVNAVIHGVEIDECYDGDLIVVNNRERPITPGLIAKFSELVAITEFQAPVRRPL